MPTFMPNAQQSALLYAKGKERIEWLQCYWMMSKGTAVTHRKVLPLQPFSELGVFQIQWIFRFSADKYHTVANGVQKHILCPAELSPALTRTAAGTSRCWQSGLTPIFCASAQKAAPLSSCSAPDAAFLSPSPAKAQAVLPSPAHCFLTFRTFCWMLLLAIIIGILRKKYICTTE